jgi:hypothetical protein
VESRGFEVGKFRELTARVIAAEKPGFWSDWTPKQRALYDSGDWQAFSRSRGYSEHEIAEFQRWLDMIAAAKAENINPYAFVINLTTAAALANIATDTKEEIMKSSRFLP